MGRNVRTLPVCLRMSGPAYALSDSAAPQCEASAEFILFVMFTFLHCFPIYKAYNVRGVWRLSYHNIKLDNSGTNRLIFMKLRSDIMPLLFNFLQLVS
jgi:hypothetical protein